jgi:RNA polymerase sigma factor (sigma-70 family)
MKTFDDIIAESKSIVFAAAKTYLYNPQDDNVSDIAQDVYIILYSQWQKKRLRTIKDIENYIYTITKHECLKWNKKNAKLEYILSDTLTYSPPNSENCEQKEQLRALIQEAPEKYRDILTLVINDFRLSEISKGLALNINTVKSLFMRGKLWLINYKKETR